MIWGTWILSVLLIRSILSQVFRRILCNCNDTIRIYHLFASIMKSSASFLIPLLPILFAHTLSLRNICWFFFSLAARKHAIRKASIFVKFVHSFIYFGYKSRLIRFIQYNRQSYSLDLCDRNRLMRSHFPFDEFFRFSKNFQFSSFMLTPLFYYQKLKTFFFNRKWKKCAIQKQ